MSTVSFIIKIGNTNSGGFRLIEVRRKNFRFMCCCHTIGKRGRGAVQNMFTLATSTPIFCLGFSSLPLMTTEGGGRVVAMTTEDRGCAAAMTTEDGGHVVAMTTENGGYVVAMTTEDRGTCNYIFFSTKLWSREARNNKKNGENSKFQMPDYKGLGDTCPHTAARIYYRKNRSAV